MADHYEVDELISVYDEFSRKNEKTMDDVVIAYEAIVALTIKAPLGWTFARMDLDRLRWSKQLILCYQRLSASSNNKQAICLEPIYMNEISNNSNICIENWEPFSDYNSAETPGKDDADDKN